MNAGNADALIDLQELPLGERDEEICRLAKEDPERLAGALQTALYLIGDDGDDCAEEPRNHVTKRKR